MKTINFFVAAIMLVAFTMSASAQLSLQAGYVHPTTTTNVGGVKETTSLNGVQIGGMYNVAIQDPVSVQVGLLYSYLFKNESVLGGTLKNKAHVLDVPALVVATFPLANDIKVFGFAGPDFSYALSGKTTASGLGLNIESGDWYGSNGSLSRFNLQFGLGAGISYKAIALKAGYNFGLIDIDKIDGSKTHGSGFSIALAYTL